MTPPEIDGGGSAAAAWRVWRCGDAALAVGCDAELNPDVNAKAVEIARQVRAAGLAGVRDVVPTHSAVTVYVDPLVADTAALSDRLRRWAASAEPETLPGRELTVGVRYGGPGGPDLGAVAAFAECSLDEVVQRHAAARYRVFMLGFLPGFAYMGVVDRRIAMPRRQTPRVAVPARAVGIAGRQTGIYPAVAPGGWQLIGTAELEPFRLDGEPACVFRPGDLVRFEPRSVEAP